MWKYYIKFPVWGSQSIGIADKNIKGVEMEIEILYEDQAGNRVYPNVYRMVTKKMKKYPTRSFGNTPPLHIIPIADFEEIVEEELTEDQKKYKTYCDQNGINFNKNNA